MKKQYRRRAGEDSESMLWERQEQRIEGEKRKKKVRQQKTHEQQNNLNSGTGNPVTCGRHLG